MPPTGLPFKWIWIVLKGNNIVNLLLLFALSEKNTSEVKNNKKTYLLDGQLQLWLSYSFC